MLAIWADARQPRSFDIGSCAMLVDCEDKSTDLIERSVSIAVNRDIASLTVPNRRTAISLPVCVSSVVRLSIRVDIVQERHNEAFHMPPALFVEGKVIYRATANRI